MKILQVSHGFPPEQSAGTERYTWQVARALRQRGHDVTVFTRRADWRLPEYGVAEDTVDGMPVFRVNHTWRVCASFEDSYRHPAVADRFGELLDRLRPDVIHVQHLVHLSTRLPEEAARRKIPVVMTFHDYWFLCNQGQLLRRDGALCAEAVSGSCLDCADLWLAVDSRLRRLLTALERWWPDLRYRASPLRGLVRPWFRWRHRQPARQAAMVRRMRARREEMLRVAESIAIGLVPSRTLLDQLLALGLPRERLRVLSYGSRAFDPPAPPRAVPGPLRAAFLGQVLPAKGVHVFLQAAERLAGQRAEFHCYGGPPPYGDVDGYAGRMRRHAAKLPHVRWHGAYAWEVLPAILQQIDVVVVPSVWYENQPFVILEAFAAGIPVVATNLGGMAELVQDGRNGLLFPRADARALAGCLERLAQDPGLLARLRQGVGGVKRMEDHTLELESIYASACHARNA